MSLQKRRSRVVWFRISPDEYDRLSEYCASSGARSISDLTRSAVDRFVGLSGEAAEAPLVSEIQKLESRIKELDQHIEQIAILLRIQLDEEST